MKKTIKKVVSLLLVTFMVFGSAPLAGFVGLELPEFSLFTTKAEAVTSGYYTYTVSGGNATITDVSESISGDIIIPSTLGGYPVTSIGNLAFHYCKRLTSITIPDSVTSIGNETFHYCYSLTSITIPDSVTSIGDNAFYRCNKLSAINVSLSNKFYSNDEYGVLFNKDKTSLIQYPVGNVRTSYSIPDSVTSIAAYAFVDCSSFTSITIPNRVTSIGDSAFCHCNSLTSITIPDSVTSIGDHAFYGCNSLTSITIPDGVTSIGDHAFYGCNSLTSITIPDGVTTIGDYAFYECDSLTSITIPDGVTTIGDYAFYECDSLRSITIPDSVTSIGDRTFKYCDNLTSITFLDSVISIGNEAFYYCKSLTSITIPDSVTSIGDYAFYSCNNLTSVSIGNEVTSIGGYAFYNCDSLTSITIPDSVTSIGDYAFLSCNNLTSIIVNSDNTSYSSDEYGVLFNNDKTELIQHPAGNERTSYTIPDSVTSIGGCAFAACKSLASITIPGSVARIGNSAFTYCTSLTSIIIPDSVTTIGDYAFEYCYSLTSVTIGNRVTSIGEEAFYGCDSLTDVYYTGTETQWNKISIDSGNYDLIYANIHYNYIPDFIFSESTYTQTHVVDDFLTEYDKYENEYLSGCGIAMDGTGELADLCVPGLTKDDNMVPQGITYYPQKDWILISAYSKNENVPSVIYALDKSTGKYVAQFDVFNGNKIFTGKLGGIAVSYNNLYFSNGKSISYIPLSEFNVANGTKKIVEIEGTQSLAGLFGEANISYVSFSDGVLYAGNFYNETEKYKKPVMQNLNSIVIGYKISGEDSESEWKEFVSKGEVSDYNYSIPNAIDEIQCALVKDGKLYLSCSYGRKNDSRLYVVEVGSATDKTINEADFSCLAPPMMEGITFIGDELYAVFESGAYFYREKSFYNKAKNPTDVVWKIDCESLMSENTTSSGDCKEYNVLYGDGIIPVNLKQSWFRNDSLQYKHELAQLCSKFATLGYNTDSLKSGLNALGFNSDRIFWETKAEKDKVDTFIADRSISVDGETYTLLFVGCIGTNTVQWVSNFEPGTGETHASFNAAKNYVYESLEKYIVNNKIDTSKLKILLCGHSRGAATANILAAKLIDEEILTTKENIYTYTFATPNPTSSENRFDEKYNRIFNFVNPEDFVTKVIPAKWGYGRYGRTFTLPSLTNTVTYINLNKRMQDTYDIMMKHSYHPYPGGEYLTYKVVNAITSVVKNIFQLYSEKFIWLGEWKSIQEFFVESLCSYLANEEGSPERKEAQDLLLKTFLVRTSSSAILSLTDYFVHYQGIGGLTGGVVLDDYFQEAHQAVTYCAYMMSMTASQAITERKAFMNTVNCPVDIEVYNKATGELVGKIVNNVIDEEVAAKDNAIVMNVNGDSKSFWLPSDGEFDVRLSGNDNGTMDYSVSAIDSADSSEIQRVNFFDVAVEYGATMSGEFSGEDFSLDEYILTLDDNNSIKPDEKLDESELQDIFVNVITEGIGYTDGNITVTSGDYVTVTATTDEGNSFIGWYENDVLVSAEAEYSFVAKENRNLVAKFTNNYSIQWNVDGEITETYSAPGTAIIMPESPEKEGYRFIGWTPEVPATMPSKDIVTTAVFAANSYDAVFNANGGAWAVGATEKTVVTAFDSEIIVPENPTKQGYIFSKWTPEVGKMDDVNGKTFKAEWLASTETVYAVETYTMNLDGEYVKTVQNFTGATDSVVNAEYSIKEGFTFNEEKSVISGIVAADNSLVLKIYYDRNKYTFTTIVDGVENSAEYYYDAEVSAPETPSKTGYTFVKWDNAVPSKMPAKDVTVNAVWNLNSYNVKWIVDGKVVKNENVNYGSGISAPTAPAKTGYAFKGWTPEVPATMPSNDLTFTAVYEASGPIDQDVVKRPSQTTISYGDAIILHVDASMIPAGGRVEWTASNNNFSYKANGATCEIRPEKSGDTTFTATIYDVNGNPVLTDEQTMTAKAGFFDKIIAFFKGLFGLSKTYPNVFKGIF